MLFTEQDIADLRELAKKIKDDWSLCGFMGNCEKEVMVGQTIRAATINLEKRGEGFSVRGDNCLIGRQRCGTDNASAYNYLINNEYFEEAERVIAKKKIVVIFPTRKLLDELKVFFARK